jgi:PAS domain S-box-containing protein
MDLTSLGERLVQGMPEALVVADAEGLIRFWNAGAERIFGFTRDEALGQSLDIITPERLRARHWTGFRRTMETGETKYGAGDLLSVPAIRKDGARISIQFSILPIAGPDGRLQGIAAIMRDITADFETRKALQRELDAYRRTAQDA